MKLFVDTREQKPLWKPIGMEPIEYLTLSEGDYTTDELYGIAHAERKSPIDLYGSIIQGHNRFRRELLRALDKNIRLAIFVECSRADFVSKRFDRGWCLKAPSKVLAQIVTTIERKYSVPFIWCKDREDMKEQILLWFRRQSELCGSKLFTPK